MALRDTRSRSSLKFKGRTPSRFGSGPDAQLMGGEALRRGHRTRAWAWRAALLFFALSLVAAFARHKIGDNVAWSAQRPLQIFAPTSFKPTAKTANVQMPLWENLFAAPVSLAEWTQRLDPQEIGVWGFVWLWLFGVALLLAWFAWARVNNWRAPRPVLGALVWLQVLAGAYYLSSFRAPVRRIETRFVAFDFHCHSTLSNGLLSPQQQINWHRARGFKGLAFTEADRLVPASTLEALRRANPDMILLGGSEYHARDAHMLFFGLQTPIDAAHFDVPSAIREGKRQGTIVISPHSWSARATTAQLINWGVDGFEGWNGIIGDETLAERAAQQNLIVTGATDTLSKSGADCYVWNLLPADTQTPAQVLAALKSRRVGVAHALTKDETPAAWNARHHQKSPFVLWRTWRETQFKLSRSQRLGAWLQVLAALCLALWWGARDAVVIAAPVGPNSAMNFLRRRRFVLRACGALLMALAWIGSLALARVFFGGGVKDAWSENLTPLHAIALWALLDGGFCWGRHLWRRVH